LLWLCGYGYVTKRVPSVLSSVTFDYPCYTEKPQKVKERYASGTKFRLRKNTLKNLTSDQSSTKWLEQNENILSNLTLTEINSLLFHLMAFKAQMFSIPLYCSKVYSLNTNRFVLFEILYSTLRNIIFFNV